jgi:hypothetical protein
VARRGHLYPQRLICSLDICSFHRSGYLHDTAGLAGNPSPCSVRANSPADLTGRALAITGLRSRRPLRSKPLWRLTRQERNSCTMGLRPVVALTLEVRPRYQAGQISGSPKCRSPARSRLAQATSHQCTAVDARPRPACHAEGRGFEFRRKPLEQAVSGFYAVLRSVCSAPSRRNGCAVTSVTRPSGDDASRLRLLRLVSHRAVRGPGSPSANRQNVDVALSPFGCGIASTGQRARCSESGQPLVDVGQLQREFLGKLGSGKGPP